MAINHPGDAASQPTGCYYRPGSILDHHAE